MRSIRRKIYIASAVLLVFLLGCAGPVHAKTKSFNSVYCDLSNELLSYSCKRGKNVMISPLSVLTAVSMLQNGASGKTRTEMVKALGSISTKTMTSELSALTGRISSSKAYTFRAPCSVWYHKKYVVLKKKYGGILKKAFAAQLHPEDFSPATVNKINQWVSDQTNGKIKSIINDLSDDDRALLINAAYFKAPWAQPYSGSTKRTFYRSDGKREKVPMMDGTESQYFEIGGAVGFVKPYKGGRLAFAAILPPKGTSPEAFLKKTSGSRILKAYRSRQVKNVVVRTRMPKFRYSSNMSMKDPLRRIGIRSAFSDSAEFHNMTKADVHADDVLHKTYICLDEEGTEAAAVTAIVMKVNSMYNGRIREKTVYLDRPFIYWIVESSSGLPVFAGIVNDP